MPVTVAQYFLDKLGENLEPVETNPSVASPQHPEFHIETGCGADCRAAIDAAAEMRKHALNAGGVPLGKRLVDYARVIVRIYVYG